MERSRDPQRAPLASTAVMVQRKVLVRNWTYILSTSWNTHIRYDPIPKNDAAELELEIRNR